MYWNMDKVEHKKKCLNNVNTNVLCSMFFLFELIIHNYNTRLYAYTNFNCDHKQFLDGENYLYKNYPLAVGLDWENSYKQRIDGTPKYLFIKTMRGHA